MWRVGPRPRDRSERLDTAFQERFLSLGRIDPVDRLARVGQPEHEHVATRVATFRDTVAVAKRRYEKAPKSGAAKIVVERYGEFP